MNFFILYRCFSDPEMVSIGDSGGAVLVPEPDGGAAPVRAKGGDLCKADRQPQAARGAGCAHVSGHPCQAQRETVSLTASLAGCMSCVTASDSHAAGHLAKPPVCLECGMHPTSGTTYSHQQDLMHSFNGWF